MVWRGLLVLVVGMVVVHAAPAHADALIDALPLAGVRHQEGEPAPRLPLTPAGVLDAAGRADDPDTFLAAERALLERAWGTRAGDWREAAAATPAPEGSTVRVPLNPTDLNGDGHGDALFFEVGYDALNIPVSAGLTALDGRSGRRMWSRDYGDPYDLLVLSPGDLTGDGAADLVVVRVGRTITRTALPGAGTAVRPYRDEAVWRWDLALLDGRHGADRWTQAIDGDVVYTGSLVGGPPAGVEAAWIDATNGLFELRRSGDDNGDGVADVLVTRYDFSSALLFGQLVHGGQTLLTAHAASLDGASGAPIYERTGDPGPGGATLRSAGDATGDGRDDLLWAAPAQYTTPAACRAGDCASAQRTTLDLELVDGASHEGAWTNELRDPDVVAAAPVLVDGGAVFLGELGAGGGQQLVAISGATGDERWRLDTVLSDVPTPMGRRLLLWEGSEPDGVDFRLRLRRIDAVTGEEVLVTEHDLPGADATLDVMTATPVGDVDGDGAPDVGLDEWHFTPPWEPDGTAHTLLSVESGRRGTTLYEAHRDRKALLFAGGDLRPGGAGDLLEGSTAYDDRGFLRFSAIAMPDGHTLWTRDDVVTTARFGPARTGAGDDVIYGRTLVTGDPTRVLSRIDALDGASGTVRWGEGDALPEIAASGPGSHARPGGVVEVPPEVSAPPSPPLPPVAAPPRIDRAMVSSMRRRGRRLLVRLACRSHCEGRLVVRIRGRAGAIRSRRFALDAPGGTVTVRVPRHARVKRVFVSN